MPKLMKESPTSSPTKEKSPNGKNKSKNQKEPADVKSVNGSAPKKGKAQLEILYPTLEVKLCLEKDQSQLTGEDAKEIIGWSENPGGNLDFKENYLLKDRYDKKIRCLHNQRNRPFTQQLADDYALEILRRKWKFNGETIVFDKYGEDQSGQHRLIGLILAVQDWHRDQTKPKGEQLWQSLWSEEPWIEALIVFGIEATDDVLNTLDTGRPRTFVDALYRSEWVKDLPADAKLEVSKTCNWALKLVWDRTQRGDVSLAPRRPHSESFEFLSAHSRLMECVQFIRDEGEGKRITAYLPLGYAAGLLYLMGSATSDADDYAAVPNESSLDWKLLDRAQEFWVDFAANGKATEPLREALDSDKYVPLESGGSFERNLKVGMIIKGWNLFSNKKKITEQGVAIEWSADSEHRLKLSENPRIGGIDVEYATEEEVPPEPVAKESKGKTPTPVVSVLEGECPKGGEHVWRDDEDGAGPYCERCLEPKTTARKKGA